MTGTPSRASEIQRQRSEKIKALLAAHFPNHRTSTNIFDVPGFAADLDFAHETLYKAIRQEREVSREVAGRIIQRSRTLPGAKPITYAQLLPFMFHDWKEHGRSSEAPEGIDDLLA